MQSADFERLEAGRDGLLRLPYYTGLYFSLISGIKLRKAGI